MMIAHKQRSMIPRSPPETAPAYLKRGIADGELCVQFLQVDIVAVSGGSDAQRMLVADEFGICAQGHCVCQFDPPSQISLNLLSIRIVLPHAVFPEPYASMPNRKGVSLELSARAIANCPG